MKKHTFIYEEKLLDFFVFKICESDFGITYSSTYNNDVYTLNESNQLIKI